MGILFKIIHFLDSGGLILTAAASNSVETLWTQWRHASLAAIPWASLKATSAQSHQAELTSLDLSYI